MTGQICPIHLTVLHLFRATGSMHLNWRAVAALVAPLLLATGYAVADAGPVKTYLSSAGDQPLARVFSIRVEAHLPDGRQEWRHQRNGAETVDPLVTPHWEIRGAFTESGPLEAVGDPREARAGDRYFVTQDFRCTAAGTARVDFDGAISYEVVAGGGIGGVLRLGDIDFTETGQGFECLTTLTDDSAGAVSPLPPGASVGSCDPDRLETEYGTFVGRIWREPGTDPMLIPQSMLIKTEVGNTFRSNRFSGASWNLAGDLWEWAGSGVAPRHANNGQHPWLYVGSPDHPYRDQATFSCKQADVAGMVHLMKIRWPDPDDATAPLREATLTCWLPPFKCAAEEEREPR